MQDQDMINAIANAIRGGHQQKITEIVEDCRDEDTLYRLIDALESEAQHHVCREGSWLLFIIPVLSSSRPETTEISQASLSQLKQEIDKDDRVGGHQNLYLSDALYRLEDLPTDAVSVSRIGDGLYHLMHDKPATRELIEAMESVEIAPDKEDEAKMSLRFIIGIAVGLEPKLWRSVAENGGTSASRDTSSFQAKWEHGVALAMRDQYPEGRIAHVGAPALYFDGLREGTTRCVRLQTEADFLDYLVTKGANPRGYRIKTTFGEHATAMVQLHSEISDSAERSVVWPLMDDHEQTAEVAIMELFYLSQELCVNGLLLSSDSST